MCEELVGVSVTFGSAYSVALGVSERETNSVNQKRTSIAMAWIAESTAVGRVGGFYMVEMP